MVTVLIRQEILITWTETICHVVDFDHEGNLVTWEFPCRERNSGNIEIFSHEESSGYCGNFGNVGSSSILETSRHVERSGHVDGNILSRGTFWARGWKLLVT